MSQSRESSFEKYWASHQIQDPEGHKAKLLEMIQEERTDKYEDKNSQDIIIRT